MTAVPLIVIAVGLLATPKARQDGWPSVVPSTVLILGAPVFMHPDADGTLRSAFWELHERASFRDPSKTSLADWQMRWLLRQCIDRTAKLSATEMNGSADFGPCTHWSFMLQQAMIQGLLHKLELQEEFQKIPVNITFNEAERWPVDAALIRKVQVTVGGLEPYAIRQRLRACRLVEGTPLPCRVSDQQVFGCYSLTDDAIEISTRGLAGPTTLFLDFELFANADDLWTSLPLGVRTTSMQVDFVGKVDQYVVPVHGELDEAMVRDLTWRLRLGSTGTLMLTLQCPSALPGTTFTTPFAELRVEGRVVADEVCFLSHSPGGHGSKELIVREPLRLEERAEAAWTLRLTGSPLAALREGTGNRYWAGTVEFPVHWTWDGSAWVAAHKRNRASSQASPTSNADTG